MEAADLGIMRWDADRDAIAVMFGDNFTFEGLRGEWQSPSIVMYDRDFNVLGVPTVDGIVCEPRHQLWPYQHNNPVFSTVLPTDFIKIGDWWFVHVMVTKGLGNEVWTEWQRSRDLVTWEFMFKTQPPVPSMVMLTFDRVGDWVYIFGTGGLKRDKPIWLWRSHVDEFPYGFERYELKGWACDERSVLPGRFGELSFRLVDGRCVLSFFDAANYRMSCKVFDTPVDDLSSVPTVDYLLGVDVPWIYGGYISPLSTLNRMQFAVSQWDTRPASGNRPYKAILCVTAVSPRRMVTDVR